MRARAWLACAAWVALGPGSARAAPPRAKPPSGADASADRSAPASRVKPAAERTLGAPVGRKPLGSAHAAGGPTGAGSRPAVRGPRVPEQLRARLKALLDGRIERDVEQIRSLRAEGITLLTAFIGETPKDHPVGSGESPSREMPEAMMRLGELRWELERDTYVDRFKAWEARPVDQRGVAPEPNFTPSRDLFGRVMKDYPWFGQMDLVLYVDGFLATEQGKQDEAIDRFSRILRDYPRSRFVADAHMARAEALFTGKYDYQAALREYEEVLKFKESELYGLALFKSAWCLWRLGNTDEAARRFVSVFEVESASSSQRKQLDELQSEALKYLVEVFTEDDKNTAQDVYAFLTKIGGDRFAGKVVKALAETFYDQAHYERGIEAYELLLKLEPTSRDAGVYVLQVAAGYNALEEYAKLKAVYERALAQYTAGGPWSRTQGDPANVAATSGKIEAQLREHAAELHAKAQKDKTSRAEYEGAAGLYDAYLGKFSSEAKAYEVHFSLAEIDFYHLEKNTEASTHYMAAARAIPSNDALNEPLKTLRHDAIYNAIAALERVRVAELEARKKQPSQESETDKKFAEALDLYAQLYPNDPALPELLFRQGKLYYDYTVYDTAVKIWGGLVEKFPSSKFAAGAGELILDSFNRAKNYENIETWARRLKSAPAFASAAQQTRLDAFIVQAVFKQGEQKALAGEHGAAATAYLRAAKEFPRDPRAAQACVNAELEAEKAGDVATLKEAAQLAIGKDYRDKPESPVGAWTAASTFQAMGLFTEAAELDEAMVALNDRDHPHYQKYEHAKDAAYNAVILREATGDHDRAVADGTKFLGVYGSSAEADEVVFQMGRAHQNAGRHKDAADLYKRYVARAKNQDHRVQGYVLLAVAELKLNDERAADESLKDAVAIGKHRKAELGPDGRYAAARARYMEGERVLARFEQIQIAGDLKQLSARLKQKTELLKSAATVFLDTVSLGVAEWSTAALYQIGHTYEAFAKSLREAPAPSNLPAADKEAFTAQIEGFVVPIEEKSLDAYEGGWKKALELGIYNQWPGKMREALGRLNGELYPPFREVGFDVRSAGPVALPALIEAPRRGPEATPEKPVAPTKPKPVGKKPGGKS